MSELDHLNSLSQALNSCIYKDAEDVDCHTTDWVAYREAQKTKKPVRLDDYTVPSKRRPTIDYDLEVYAMFTQTWGSTALGFGGMGGAAMTTAYTIILHCHHVFYVYWNGQFAYKTKDGDVVRTWIKNRWTPDKREFGNDKNS